MITEITVVTFRHLALCNSQKYTAYACHKLSFQVPKEEAKWKEIALGFNTKWNFPNCAGAMDGNHINIKCPSLSGSQFYNYKGNFSTIFLPSLTAITVLFIQMLETMVELLMEGFLLNQLSNMPMNEKF
jgi:hypothetical protein